MNVNIYTMSSIKSLRATNGAIGYVLETETSQGIKTLEDSLIVKEVTNNQSELIALIEALKRMRKPCELTIYTESEYVAAGFTCGWVEKWIEAGWMTTRKKEVSNKAEWQQLNELLKIHEYEFRHSKHEYTSWLTSTVNSKAKEN